MVTSSIEKMKLRPPQVMKNEPRSLVGGREGRVDHTGANQAPQKGKCDQQVTPQCVYLHLRRKIEY
jgi:hypothetical protein